MHRDHARAIGREHVPEGEPHAPAFAVRPRVQALLRERPIQVLQARAVVPEQRRSAPVGAAQRRERALHLLELLALRCARNADDHVRQVRHALELIDDALQRDVVKLGVKARQHQRDRTRARRVAEFALEPREVAAAEAVQRGDHAGLMEVAHAGDPGRKARARQPRLIMRSSGARRTIGPGSLPTGAPPRGRSTRS